MVRRAQRGLELAMYPAIESFLTSMGAEGVGSAVKGKAVSFRLQGKLIRPDVFGVLRTADGRKVVMGEGKLLGGRRFTDCIADGETLLQYADQVYCFFPREQWYGLKKNERDANRSYAQQRGLGVLLVGRRGSIEVLLEAPQSTRVTEASHRDALHKIAPDLPDFPVLGSLVEPTLRKAMNAGLDLAYDIVIPLLEKTGARRSEPLWTGGPDGLILWVDVGKGSRVELGIDPFGSFCRDGAPAVLLFSSLFASKSPPKSLTKLPGSWIAYRLPDAAPSQPLVLLRNLSEDRVKSLMNEAGKLGEVAVCEVIPLSGQTKLGLERRLIDSLGRFRRFWSESRRK